MNRSEYQKRYYKKNRERLMVYQEKYRDMARKVLRIKSKTRTDNAKNMTLIEKQQNLTNKITKQVPEALEIRFVDDGNRLVVEYRDTILLSATTLNYSNSEAKQLIGYIQTQVQLIRESKLTK